MNKNKSQLEIWDRTQREGTRCLKSDWAEFWVWNSASSNVSWPERNRLCLHSTRSGDLGWVKM